mmetsp:Transcript_13101/g.28194  ORF Transcript_13101/g.28194 Transcript_13101/m.28194 type:complete len:233 (+) Transcript_13101:262-960(+)
MKKCSSCRSRRRKKNANPKRRAAAIKRRTSTRKSRRATTMMTTNPGTPHHRPWTIIAPPPISTLPSMESTKEHRRVSRYRNSYSINNPCKTRRPIARMHRYVRNCYNSRQWPPPAMAGVLLLLLLLPKNNWKRSRRITSTMMIPNMMNANEGRWYPAIIPKSSIATTTPTITTILHKWSIPFPPIILPPPSYKSSVPARYVIARFPVPNFRREIAFPSISALRRVPPVALAA